MFDILTIVKILNVIEILVSTILFSIGLRKRKYWWLVLILVSAAMLCWAIFVRPFDSELPFVQSLFGILMFLPLWLFSLLGLFLSLNETPYKIVMASIAGYTTQKIASLLNTLFSLINPSLFSIAMQKEPSFLPFLIIIVGDAIAFTTCYFIFAKPMRANYSKAKPTVLRFSLVIAAAAANLIFGLLYTVGMEENPNSPILIVSYLQNFLACILILCVTAGFFGKDAAEWELEQSKRVYALSRENYKNEKAVIEVVNQKVHDLKHRMLEIEQGQGIDLSDIHEAVDIYDASLHTGSEALDIVVKQKLLICQKYQIEPTLIINAEKLAFMKNADIFVLFGNLFDNAINALAKIEDPKRRILYVKIFDKSGIFLIGFENEYVGDLIYEHGTYKTTNPNKKNHGYGIHSIQDIVTKYQGTIEMSAENHFFHTSISFLL